MNVPYLDLSYEDALLGNAAIDAMRDVIRRRDFVLGESVERFETEFAHACGAAHCVGVNSGTSALHLALLAAGVGPGDEVITQTNTFAATVAAIMYTGARPVLVDVSPPTYAIDIDRVASAVGPYTRAIIPVHMFGHPADLDALAELAGSHRLTLIEDAAQAHGARYAGRPVGSGPSAMATFSFYPSKNLGAYGEGGGIVFSDDRYDRPLRILRNHGSTERYVHQQLGFNYRMEGLQAAVLSQKLPYLQRWNADRRRIAQRYDALLSGVERPLVPPSCESAYHVYPVLVADRDRIRKQLDRAGISTNIHYPLPCHLQTAFSSLGYRRGDFPHAETLARRELSLPIYPGLLDEQVDYVAATLLDLLR